MADFDYSHESMMGRRRERGKELGAQCKLWRAQYLIRRGTHVAVAIEPTEADIERMAKAHEDAFARYRVEGTTDDEFGGPPYRAPWFLIDTSTAEPEVNWPGELVAEYDTPQPAYDHKYQLQARAAHAALVKADDCRTGRVG